MRACVLGRSSRAGVGHGARSGGAVGCAPGRDIGAPGDPSGLREAGGGWADEDGARAQVWRPTIPGGVPGEVVLHVPEDLQDRLREDRGQLWSFMRPDSADRARLPTPKDHLLRLGKSSSGLNRSILLEECPARSLGQCSAYNRGERGPICRAGLVRSSP